MADHDLAGPKAATMEQRVDAVQAALDARGFKATEAVDELSQLAEEQWLPRDGARVVARAWA
ncbi:MAG: nitrile hydratase subunit alpha, partial [Pseudomonadota bacterium]|nr:nitrile hydratase subunit alpha [Pseudomonadota bacterium]